MRRSGSIGVTVLEKLPLFAGLSPRELGRIARLVGEVEVPAETRLAGIGEVGRELFIILDGQARVTTRKGQSVRLGPGDFFGEMSLIDGEPRSATVEAATPMRVVTLGYREFWQLLDEELTIVRKIMRTLSRRLRQAEKSVSA